MKINKQSLLFFTLLILLNSNSLSAEDLHITLPDVPEVPKVNAKVVPAVNVIVHNSQFKESQTKEQKQIKKGILFSKRVPPNYNEKIVKIKVKNLSEDEKSSLAGKVINNRVSSYLVSKITSVDDVIAKLEDADFTILTKYAIDRKKNYISVVFTNKDILKAASKFNRGFAASLRLLIDKKNMTVSINNPLFVMKAFMQEQYNEPLATKTLNSLKDSFKNIKDYSELIKFSHLTKYQFMTGMPYYEDMLEVGSAGNTTLLAKAKKSKKMIFEQKLNNGAVLIGVKLSRQTSRFVKKIGYEGGDLLPYPILVENNKAKILAPKYYIALFYPSLSMSQFMGIASIPDSIRKDCARVFR